MGLEEANLDQAADEGKETQMVEFEETNALSVLATAGEMDIARSPPGFSPMSKKDQSLMSSVDGHFPWRTEENGSQDRSAVVHSNRPERQEFLREATTISRTANGDDKGEPALSQKCCNCRSTGCLKRYCDCFKAGQYCTPKCSCQSCKNNAEHAPERAKAINLTLGRDPNAFRPKISKTSDKGLEDAKHSRGCHCKRTACLKGYCECFQAQVHCSELCKCTGCKNHEHSHELQVVRANQLENGQQSHETISNGIVHEIIEPTPKRIRMEEQSPASVRRPNAFERGMESPVHQNQPKTTVATATTRGGRFGGGGMGAGGTNVPMPALSGREVTNLVQRQCYQLMKIAEEEVQLSLTRRQSKVRTEGDADVEGLLCEEDGVDDVDDTDLQLAVERALIEETAAMLTWYNQQLQHRLQKAAPT